MGMELGVQGRERELEALLDRTTINMILILPFFLALMFRYYPLLLLFLPPFSNALVSFVVSSYSSFWNGACMGNGFA